MATRHELQIYDCFSLSLVHMPVLISAESSLILKYKQFPQTHHVLFPRHCLPSFPPLQIHSIYSCLLSPICLNSRSNTSMPWQITTPGYCSFSCIAPSLQTPFQVTVVHSSPKSSHIPSHLLMPVISPSRSLPYSTGWCTMPVAPSPHSLTHHSNPPSVLPFTISVHPFYPWR